MIFALYCTYCVRQYHTVNYWLCQGTFVMLIQAVKRLLSALAKLGPTRTGSLPSFNTIGQCQAELLVIPSILMPLFSVGGSFEPPISYSWERPINQIWAEERDPSSACFRVVVFCM